MYQIQKKIDKENLKYIISKNSKDNILYYLIKHDENVFHKTNTIIIQDYFYDFSMLKLNKKYMVVNLKNKERMGTTDVGEEFVRFLSRYGIRFNRID